MSITIYNDGDHPGGFIGIRVCRTVNKTRHQKYFSYRVSPYSADYISLALEQKYLKQATKLDNKWKSLQKRRIYECQVFKSHHNAIIDIGLTGIRPTIIHECRKNTHYYAPAFIVRGQKSFRILKLGYRHAWIAAAKHLKLTKKLTTTEYETICSMIPKAKIFYTLKKHMLANGHDIPLFDNWEL